MKYNYDIRMNPKGISKNEIARHKDFDALLRKYHQTPQNRPLLKRIVYISTGIAAAVALVFFAVQIFNSHNNTPTANAYFATQPFINPPLDHIQPNFNSFNIDAATGGVFENPGGSKLTVPAAAFVSNTGDPVQGNVTLHYRELHDFVDFFLSGIPMTYDSAGVQYTLESAGMIEMFAEQDGKRVNMAPGKSIGVELISRVNVAPSLGVPPGYNIYKLNVDKRNWEYREIDRMTILDDGSETLPLDENSPLYPARKELREKMKAIQVTEATEMAAIEASLPKPQKPIQPQKANGAGHVFDLDFSDLRNPNATGEYAEAQRELAELYRQYEKMLWQVSPESTITPEQLKQGFSLVTGIQIRKLNARDFELTLSKGDSQLVVVTNPVLSGNDYENALTDFNKEFAVWEQQIVGRETRLKAQKEELLLRMAARKEAAGMAYENKVQTLRNQGLADEATGEIIKHKVINRFQATAFGIWNCDRPLPPYLAWLKSEFKDQHDNAYNYMTGYLVDKSRNTVSRMMVKKGMMFSFNRNSDNLFWIVTKDNKIAVFRPEDFKGIKKEDEAYTFVLDKIEREIKDEKDAREILYL
jgi:hypothetical protein